MTFGLLAMGAAQAATLEGSLELIWGDAAPGSVAAVAPFRASVVDDAGQRHELDPEAARAAAGDLYALQGQRVAVQMPDAAMNAGFPVAPLRIDRAPESPRSAQPAPDAVVGTQVWVTILCKFSDIATEQQPLAFFSNQYANSSGRLDHYWREVSYDKINLVGSSAYGWFNLPQPRTFYTPSGQSTNLNKLFDDCTAAANATVNFAANGGVAGINMMFNGDLDGYAWGGSRFAVLDGISRSWRSTWNPPWSFSNLAPLTHEMGHGFGLPHANNSDHDSNPYDNPWDVMSDAWSNGAHDATYGTIAKHISVYSRDRLGWIDTSRKLTVNSDGTQSGIVLDRASLAGSTHTQMIVVTLAGAATHYYTLEARKRVGTYEPSLAGDAVIIHEVDTTRGEPAWSVDASVPPADTANNEGSMFKVGETYSAPSSVFSVRIDSATADGFVVTINRTADRIFMNRFDN
ncbi:MAG: hypothetical protein ABI411_19355 [Tahibacter sp.]